MALKVDLRIGSKELVAPLRKLGAIVKVVRLDYGDACFTGYGPNATLVKVGIERKTVDDLLSCLRDNRFAGHQLPGLVARYDIRYLVVEGPFRPSHSGLLEIGHPWTFKGQPQKTGIAWFDSRFSHLMYAGLDGYLTSIEQQGKIIVARTLDMAETVFWIWSRYQWWDKPWDQHKSLQPMLKRLHRRTREVRKDDQPEALKYVRATVFRKMVAQVPSIGWVRSRAVEEAFGDWPTLMAASQDQWMAIRGIGPVIARQAWREIHWAAK